VFLAKKFRLVVIAVLGIAVALYVFKSTGLKPILFAALAIGWRGFTILFLYQLGLFVLLGAAWRVLIPSPNRLGVSVFVWARMVRDATSELLPFSHLGGIMLGARAAIARGVSRPVAFGSIVTDLTTEMLAQVAFIAVGIAILMKSAHHDSMTPSIISAAAVGLITVALSCAAFAAFQRYGRKITSKLIARLFPEAIPVNESVVDCIQGIYRQHSKVSLSVLLHFLGWVASALSTWIALSLMGVRAHVWPVLAIESLVCAARSVAFWVPNGLGVQEVAYVAVAPLFGIGAEIGLAVSVLRRAREIAVGVPILLLWQYSESRRFLAQASLPAQHSNGTAHQFDRRVRDRFASHCRTRPE
jgi:putative membrane protein